MVEPYQLWDIGTDSEAESQEHVPPANVQLSEKRACEPCCKKARVKAEMPCDPHPQEEAPSCTSWVSRVRSVMSVGEMVSKTTSPLILQTACSGTNAISIALKDSVPLRVLLWKQTCGCRGGFG